MFKKDEFIITNEKEIFIGIKNFEKFNKCNECDNKLNFKINNKAIKQKKSYIYGIYKCNKCKKKYDLIIFINDNKWIITESTQLHNKNNQIIKQGLYFKNIDDMMKEFMEINKKVEKFNKLMKPLEEFNG